MSDEYDIYQTPTVKDEEEVKPIELQLTKARFVTRNKVLSAVIFAVATVSILIWSLLYLSQSRSNRLEMIRDALTNTNTIIHLVQEAPKVNFLPETSKEEGLSLFYITSKEEAPYVSHVRFDEEVLEGLDTNALFSAIEQPFIEQQIEEAEEKVTTLNLYIELARRYANNGQLEAAEKSIATALKQDPYHYPALAFAGQLYLNQNKHQQAEEYYEKMVRQRRFDPTLLNNLAVCQIAQQKNKEALASLQKAIRLRPDYLEAQVNLALLYLQLNQLEDALATIEPALENHPNSIPGLQCAANAAWQLRKYRVARTYFEQLQSYTPLDATLYDRIARSYLYERDFTRAAFWVRLGMSEAGKERMRPLLQHPDYDPIREFEELKM